MGVTAQVLPADPALGEDFFCLLDGMLLRRPVVPEFLDQEVVRLPDGLLIPAAARSRIEKRGAVSLNALAATVPGRA